LILRAEAKKKKKEGDLAEVVKLLSGAGLMDQL
jgi:hypothetical protein